MVGLARQAGYFLMLVHKKVTKEHDTLYRLFPALLVLMSGNRTRPGKRYKTSLAAVLEQAIAENPH